MENGMENLMSETPVEELEVECLGGSGRKFRKCQIRDRYGAIHLQAKGVPVNREYGVAVDFNAPEEVLKWINEQEHTELSLAGTAAAYVPAQFIPVDEFYVQVQVKGSKFNRDYGMTFKAFAPELVVLYNNAVMDTKELISEVKTDIEEP